MKKDRAFFCQPFSLLMTGTSPFKTAILFILIRALFPSCAAKMSLDEARRVTVSMGGESFVPPPRRIDDVITLLEQPLHQDLELKEKMEKIYKTSPSKGASNKALSDFYFKRSSASVYLGRFKQALEDARLALHYGDEAKWKDKAIILTTAKHETYFGNFKRAIELYERAKREYPSNPMIHSELVKLYRSVGDLESVKQANEDGKALYELYFKYSSKVEFYHFLKTYEAETKANLLEINAKYSQAEPFRRAAITHAIEFNSTFRGKTMIKQMGSTPFIVPYFTFNIVNNLLAQGRVLEAELEARQVLKDAIATFGKDSAAAGAALALLGETLLEQNRLSGAERLMREGIRILEDSGVSSDSFFMGNVRCFLGNILMARYDFDGAVKQYDLVKENMKENQYLYRKQIAREPYIMVSLLKTGRLDEAMKLISDVYDMNSQSYGKDHYLTAEILGLRAMANAMKDNRLEAIKDYSAAVPILIGGSSGEGGNCLKRQILKIIVESYMELLTQIRGTRLEKEAGFDAAAEAFRLVDALGGQSVRGALGASSARAAVSDQDLAELIRNEQDILKQVKVLQEALANNLAIPADQQMPAVKEDLRNRIDALTLARAAILDEIKTRFPKYTDFVSPPPVTLKSVQKHLRPGEALISIYTSENRTYVWAIPGNGTVQFSSVPLGNKGMNQIITHLREALDPRPETFGDIPEFDLDQAYDLYSKLLKPVADGWKDATDLLVVTSGPLGQLPFSVLPTAPVRPGREKDELFSNYREVPWLTRKVSISRVPSVSSFIILRRLPEGDPQRKAFAGFGDPIFSRAQLARAESEEDGRIAPLASRGGGLHVRSIRLTEKGNLDSKKISSSELGKLNRLPDTAEEITSIAKAMGADPGRDVFLGKNASEGKVKAMDLSNRRVIAFASHALVPGDLDGLNQPAIALSAPSVTGDNEDGLLTMGEVLKLRLNADWVVLSACNTGAADGAGAEAVSGLGRAFFYAGTRAILVSMWPVETTSARRLTTRLFQYQKEDKTLSRARAYQKSILELIDGPGLKDEATGKIIASYAHPLFWAPFIVVGDGG